MSSIWTTPSAEDVNPFNPTPKPTPIPFDSELFAPLSFQPDDKVAFAVSRARQLLGTRSNEQCISIATAIAHMSFVIESLERQSAVSMLQQPEVSQVWLLQGRALFLWMETFDISGLGVEKIEWFEVFAVKVLMLCADFSRLKSLKVEDSDSEFKAAKIERLHHRADQLIVEIVDCLARAEMLEKHGRVHTSAKLLGSKGGKGRSLKIAPLENEVIRLYLDGHQHMPVLKAANCIAVIIEETKPELLLLTKNKDKPVAIQNIILKFRDGRAKVML